MFLHPVIGMETVKTTLEYIEAQGQVSWIFGVVLSNGTQLPVVRFGITADIYAPGDYDGDHKTDIATFRRAGGATVWNWVSSVDGSTHSVTWGSGSDFPVQGDYDGDGKTDIAIWRTE